MRCSQAVNTRAAVALRASVVRDRPSVCCLASQLRSERRSISATSWSPSRLAWSSRPATSPSRPAPCAPRGRARRPGGARSAPSTPANASGSSSGAGLGRGWRGHLSRVGTIGPLSPDPRRRRGASPWGTARPTRSGPAPRARNRPRRPRARPCGRWSSAAAECTTGTASRTRCWRRVSRSRAVVGARTTSTRCSPISPVSSRTSSARVTSVAAPLRISWCTPSDGALVTGPGTPISGRLSRDVQLAVLRAPLRTAASTTTVPRDRAAMTPVAGQEPDPHGRTARRHLGHDRAVSAEVVEELLVRGRIGAVDAAGEDGDRRLRRRPGHPGGRPGRCRTPRPRPRWRRRGPVRRRALPQRRCRRWSRTWRRRRPPAPAGHRGAAAPGPTARAARRPTPGGAPPRRGRRAPRATPTRPG